MNLATLVFFLYVFNAPAAWSEQSSDHGIATKLEEKGVFTFGELVNWLLKDGRDRIEFNSRLAEPLNLRSGGVPTKARGVPPKENPDDIGRTSNLVLAESKEGKSLQPECLVLLAIAEDSQNHTTTTHLFKIRLDGSLDRAVISRGITTIEGKGVRGSAVNTVLKTDDPEVQGIARKELNFWLRKGYELSKKSRQEEEVLKKAEQGVPEEKVP